MTRLALAVGIASFVLVMFFHQGLTANPTSRLLTVWALVEDHTLKADRWGTLTWDISIVDRHVYSDKAPLASYLVVPFYALYRLVAHPHAPQTPADREAANHIAIAVGAALPFALFVVLVLFRLVRARLAPPYAAGAALLIGLGSFAFAYGCAFFGHMLAAVLLLSAWVLAVERRRHFALAGVFAGAAVFAEYPTALGVLAILWLVHAQGRTRRDLARFLGGTAPAALAFFVHNWRVTGAPWILPYARVQEHFDAMHVAYGLRAPNWMAAWELVFSQYRGALFYAPVLALFVPLLWLHFDGSASRRLALLVLAGAYLALLSAFFRWDGGWCTGPRHLLPIVVLLLYEGAGAWATTGRFARTFLALAVLGVCINLAFAATDPIPSTSEPRPLMEVAWPALVEGRINPHNLASELFGMVPRRRLVALWVALALGALGLVMRLARTIARPAPP